MPLHSPEDVARFQSGERRLIWARDVTIDELVELPDGQAIAWRESGRSFECPMPVCLDRALHTVARHPHRRDGFAHKPGSGPPDLSAAS
ncbi:hypothetical protein ACFOYW_02320 [Gryllotalpicola reticulitermitis]|uniref:YlxR domain-containing protein n=1 Tax=Gryllotalpicola reticulitermitis TaxID=1184153 RepID=A0ABV8Q321_9MICO